MDKDLTQVRVRYLPKCDFCKEEAHYDFRTIYGYWAYGCERHFKRLGGSLGTGKGQQLLKEERREASKAPDFGRTL